MPLSVSTMWIFGHGRDQRREEVRGGDAIGFIGQFDKDEFAGPVDGDNETQLAHCGLHLGDVDVEAPDRIGFELLFG